MGLQQLAEVHGANFVELRAQFDNRFRLQIDLVIEAGGGRYQAPPPFLGRSFDAALDGWLCVVAAAAPLDLSAAVFLGFFASRFDF